MTKRMWATLLVLAMLMALVPSGMGMAASSRTTRCNLMLRTKADASSKALATIPGGTEIEVLGTSGGWTKTSYKGHTGYVSSNYLMDLTRSGYFPLKEGDESPYVKELQLRLIDMGYMTGSANGKYEASTTAAVKAFQKENGIGQDGIAGGETQRIMYGETAKYSSGESSTGTSTGSGSTDSGTSVTATATTLKLGDRSNDVKNLQTRLIELGYMSGSADGIFGAATQSAVVAFQKNSKLTADGKAGKVTQNLLYSSSALKASGGTAGSTATESANGTNSANTSYKTLKKGMTSDDVKTLQKRLKELGYLSASATGYYGSQTFAAVKSFQQTNGLNADGIAGAATQTALFASGAQKAGSSSQTDTGSTTKYTTLKEGMKSSAVTTLQKKLKELGYLSANATGYFGSATKAAVVAFQKTNGLSADGIAGSATLTKLYDGSAASSGSGSGTSTAGKITGPSASSVKLLHWFNSIKPSLKSGSTLQIFDPATSYTWNLRAMSLGRHCDSEPLTAEDTATMNKAFGNSTTWTPKVVYVKLPSGTWTMATMHNTPHLSGSISNNNFDGHLCVHFLRDMAEVSKNDPNYGVQNQKALREGWKKLTGQTVD